MKDFINKVVIENTHSYDYVSYLISTLLLKYDLDYLKYKYEIGGIHLLEHLKNVDYCYKKYFK